MSDTDRENKKCRMCQETKPITEFSKGKAKCKPCYAKYVREQRIPKENSRKKFLVNRFDDEFKQQLAEEIKNADSINEVGRKYGISHTSLHRWVQKKQLIV